VLRRSVTKQGLAIAAFYSAQDSLNRVRLGQGNGDARVPAVGDFTASNAVEALEGFTHSLGAISGYYQVSSVCPGDPRAKGLAGFGTALNCATTRWLVCAQQVRDELEQQLIAAVVAAKTEEVLAATVLAAGVSPAEAALQLTGTDATHIQEDEAAEQVDRTELDQRADAYCPGMERRK
jgi:hypothetical protein